MSNTGAAQAAPVKASLPIELLPNSFARMFSQAQPAILVSAYYFRFPSLVENPTSTLLSSLLPLALTQVVYAVISLPAVGSNVKLVKKVKLNAPRKTEASFSKTFVSSFWVRNKLLIFTDRLLRPRPLILLHPRPSRSASPLWRPDHNTYSSHPAQLRSYCSPHDFPLNIRARLRRRKMEGDSVAV